ncbi:MAG: Asp-tRNA(Asn)/Glu-tRNA(Gln) amidotransferase subunit GatC [Flavobacteriales bacterium]|nr:Asp-tRNA(Asn)/Glu-tRNA(Gln) amidotransferase subunit GatC [Flavobacteriales bacterium]MCX7649991.1 Asp-tRNA(Asn)/Glu-tRNA(Gln) amidotransferase subunit GatC [Flavobacteriales bacterium]MDW8433149.1 Asp-tRNA(Asn)/Glu-tRNA(Gln) amidotransferase subunit GatC [Flavobacteriales bacterium]
MAAQEILTPELLHHLARLSRLKVEPSEEASLLQDMEKILRFVQKINELELGATEPLLHMTTETAGPRLDIPEPALSKEDILKNAPRADSDYFRVPKILEK